MALGGDWKWMIIIIMKAIYEKLISCPTPAPFLPLDDKYQPASYETEYRVVMRLTIKSVAMPDFDAYRCVAKNSLGDTDGVIKLYRK